MSGPEPTLPVLPVVSVLSRCSSALDKAIPDLNRYFGPVAIRSRPYPFDMSDYYLPEMGAGLTRIWLCFGRLRDPAELRHWKLFCFELEESLSADGARTVNLDPGYLDHGKLVLASFKPAPDKICVGGGVWAHTCLRYRFGDFTGPDHSFPDFIDGRFNDYFRRAKSFYKNALRGVPSPEVER